MGYAVVGVDLSVLMSNGGRRTCGKRIRAGLTKDVFLKKSERGRMGAHCRGAD